MRILPLIVMMFPIVAFAQEADIVMDQPTIEVPPVPKILPNFEVGSETAFVYDLTTAEPVYQKNSTEQRSIASITKMMTAFLVVSEQLSMDEVITLTPEDISLSNKGSARSKLRAGMKFTRERLLNLALMASENRAAAALGRTSFPGGVSEFVTYMNQMAQNLHMEHTHFVDPIGIGVDNVSTAEDLVKLITAASDNDMIRDFSTTKWKEVELPTKRHGTPVEYHNTNALVGFKDWNILLQKTGFTNAAGHCVAMIVEIQGHEYAVVELDSPNNQQRAFDAIKLRHWVEEGTELATNDIKPLSPYTGILIGRNYRAPVKRKHHRLTITAVRR